jgi:hypothetical protein
VGSGAVTSEFQPNTVLFGDRAGLGRWEIGHYRQHLRYVQFLARLTPPIVIADYPIITMGNTDLERRIFLNEHQIVHELLRPVANVEGIDLSLVDLKKPEEFYVWQDVHAQEHTLIDLAFGLS